MELIDKELLDILVCPKTHQPLRLAETSVIDSLNARRDKGELRNIAGRTIDEKLDGGLVREDGKVLYAIIDGIPVLMIDDAISLDSGEPAAS